MKGQKYFFGQTVNIWHFYVRMMKRIFRKALYKMAPISPYYERNKIFQEKG